MSVFGSISEGAGNRIDDYLGQFDFGLMAIVDLALVALLLYLLFTMLRDTRALGIIYGILALFVIFIAAKLLQLELLAVLFGNLLTLSPLAIVVLFQPELRRLLERLGRTRIGMLKTWRAPQHEDTVSNVVEAVRVMAQSKTGALVVFKRSTGMSDLVTSGTSLDAEVSTPLLLNLFYDKSPLHDGAVIIDDNRIVAAGAMLPISEREYGHTLGARHRAAVGLTEQCDAVVLVVSEEKGIVSLVVGGKITPGIGSDVLPKILEEFLTSKHPGTIVKKFREKSQTAGKRLGTKPGAR